MVKIGIIGGSGLENPDILKDFVEKDVSTPFGKPASLLVCGKIDGVDVVIVSRHGRKHEFNPTNVPYKANIWALKQEGCTHVLAATAVGSLKENIKPGDLVFLNQFVDRTTKRSQTFYEDSGKVCHIPMAQPFCEKLRNLLIDSAKELNLTHHKTGTVVTIEGPRFSSKAESYIFRQWNCDVINMSTVPEVVLARESGMCYASVAMSTDYDCWHESHESVSLEMILKVMKLNADNVKKLFLKTVSKIKFEKCSCMEFIKTSII